MRFDKGYVLLIAFKHPQNKIRVKSASFKKPHLCHDCGYVTNTVQHLRSLRSWCWSHQPFKSSTNRSVQRFAHVIAQHCGHIENPLSSDSLRTLQAGILGEDALGLGLRLSPVFVGQATLREDLAHYIAPPFADGTRSNFIFDEYEDALFAWRYPDLTAHVVYTADIVAHTIHTEMAEEACVLMSFQRAQQQLKDVLEIPDQDANRIIRSLKENNWQLSGKLKNEYPQLADAVTAERVITAVRLGFEDDLDGK